MKPANWLLVTLLACIGAGCASGPDVNEPAKLVYQSVTQPSHPVFAKVAAECRPRTLRHARITVDSNDAQSADFHLELAFRIRKVAISDTEAVWEATTTMLLAMYPASCARYELELNADLLDDNGQRLGSWQVAQQDTAFVWLLSGAKDCGASQSDKTIAKISKRMLKELYNEIEEDGVLAAPGPVAVDRRPPVLLVTDYAEDIVRQSAKTSGSYANFTLDETAADIIHRTVKIRFEIVKPGETLTGIVFRSMAAIGTVGMAGACPPNEVTLSAEVLGEDGETLRTYRFKKKKKASMLDDCAPPTQTADPKLFASLLDELFRAMEKDRLQ